MAISAAATNGAVGGGAVAAAVEQGVPRPDTSQMVETLLISKHVLLHHVIIAGAIQAQGELAPWRVHAPRRRLPPSPHRPGALPDIASPQLLPWTSRRC